uniref:DNA replication fork stabilization factor DONSON n=1 Tax=Amphilophus citrinellus TaxID=61819 RepID=A0A3Q0SSS3_AMPCI
VGSSIPGYSPSFKRPAEILRMRRKRARSDTAVSSGRTGCTGQSSSSPMYVRPFSPGPLFTAQNHSGVGTKRRNPFANIENTHSPKKKLIIFNDANRQPFMLTFTPISKLESPINLTSLSACLWEETREHPHKPQENMQTPHRKILGKVEYNPASSCFEYPADWSLKTRVLFTSPLSLSWAEHLKAQEEAQGISQHCRAQFNPVPHSPQNLVYWQHPSMPWLSLFPRINAERSFSGKSTPWAQDAALQQSLMREWSISLSSLYTLLKSRLCPYFYLCSYQFTVLFRAAGLGSSSITALISPTTRGLREAMKAEGIEFSLPLLEEQRKSKDPQNLTITDGEEHDVYNRDEDGSFSWLKEMGVQDKIKKPDSHIIQLQKEGSSVSLDHKPESVICVEGPHTFTLINFLINWKGVVASSGSQAGLPPTLLAPSAFRGATMHTLKGRSVNVRSQMGSSYQNMSSLEITGPVLPSSLLAITTLLQPAQKGNFSAALCTHTPTAVLNINIIKQQVTHGSEELSSCGLHPASIQQLQQPSSLGKTALTHITMSNYSYTWKN